MDLFDSLNAPQPNATVSWFVGTATDYGTGQSSTDANGHAELSGVPAAAGNGEIDVMSAAPGAYFYHLTAMDWPAAGTALTITPGRQAVTLTAGGPWQGFWSDAIVELYSLNGTVHELSSVDVTRAATPVTSATLPVLQGTVTAADVYFLSDEGAELDTTGITATPGADTARVLACDEATAPRVSFNDYASGKPGSKEKLLFQDFPAGWVNTLSGFDWDTGKASAWRATWTSSGVGTATKTVTVPATAKPGHTYAFDVSHTTGLLDLVEGYQVCTLNASDATPKKGQTIRLSGVVPVQTGHSKRITIYKRGTAAGQPLVPGGAASVKGWTRLGTVTANGKGAYSTSLRATRTTYYIVWYPKDGPSDQGHWAAWTSVRKVAVH